MRPGRRLRPGSTCAGSRPVLMRGFSNCPWSGRQNGGGSGRAAPEGAALVGAAMAVRSLLILDCHQPGGAGGGVRRSAPRTAPSYLTLSVKILSFVPTKLHGPQPPRAFDVGFAAEPRKPGQRVRLPQPARVREGRRSGEGDRPRGRPDGAPRAEARPDGAQRLGQVDAGRRADGPPELPGRGRDLAERRARRRAGAAPARPARHVPQLPVPGGGARA